MADAQNRLRLKVGLTFSQTEELKNLKAELKRLEQNADKVNLDKALGLKQVKANTDSATKSMSKFSSGVDFLFKKFKTQAINLGIFTALSGSILFLTTRIRDAIAITVELDKAYTNFAIVTGATAEEIAYMDGRASELTQTLGRLKKEIIDSITEFSRAGFAIEDAMTLAEQATIGANIGFTDLANVTKFVVAGLKSFKLEAEDSARLIDVLFQVSNKTAIDFQGIGEAFLRSANTLQVAGATLEETTALISAANESIQDPAKVGTALKTIAARLRGVGDEGEVIPSLARDFNAVGVEIQNADGSFRDIYSIFKDFAEVYGELDDLTRQSLVEKIAGKRQANIFIGLIENFDTAEMALTEGLDSIGAAAEANQKFLESIEGKVNTLKNAVNQLYQSVTSSDFIKLLITGLTQLVKLLTLATTGFGGLITSVGLFTVAFRALILAIGVGTGGLGLIIPAIASLVSGLLIGKSAIDNFGSSIEKVSSNVQEYSNNISNLNRQIKNLEALSNRTEAEERLLSVLKEQLDVQNQLKYNEQLELAKTLTKEVTKELKSLEAGLKNYKDLTLDDFLSLDWESADVAKQGMEDWRDTLLKFQETSLGVMATTEDNTEANKMAKEEYEKVSAILAIVNLKMLEWGLTTREVVTQQVQTNNMFERLNGLLVTSRGYLQNFESETTLVKDALAEVEEQGYFSVDTLSKLQEAFSTLATETGLATDKIIEYLNDQSNASSQFVTDNIEDLEKLIETTESRIALINAEREAMAGLGSTRSMVMGENIISADYFLNKNTGDYNNILTQARARVEELKTSERDRNRILSESSDETDKQNKLLTEQERLLNEINFNISKYEKELSRTTDEKKMLELQGKLNDEYERKLKLLREEKDAVNAQLATTSKTSPLFDELTQKSYELSLAIEDTTNSMYSLVKAGEEMKRASALEGLKIQEQNIKDMQDAVEKLKDLIETMVKEDLQDQIDKNQELIDQAREQLDIKLEQLQAEEDLYNFQKSREAKEKDLSKINAKINSLRTAALQGDTKANALLIELEEERAKVQESLDEEINQRGFDLRKENLEKQFDEFESKKQDEIDVLEKNLKDAEYLAQQTNARLNEYLMQSTDTLYNNLILWNQEYGTNFDNDVISRWQKLIGLMKESQSIGNGMTSFDSFETGLNESAIINQMKQNSLNWFNASEVERRRLHEENQRLGAMIGANYDSNLGAWFKDGMRLYDNGGAFNKGDIALKNSNDTEWIMKDNQLSKVIEMSLSDFISNNLSKMKLGSGSLPPINIIIEGDVSDDNVNQISQDVRNIISQVSKGQVEAFKTHGIKPNTRIR